MKSRTVKYLTEKERAFVSLLIDIGIRRNVAKVLVILAHVPAASSHEIEQMTGLRQPEVCLAVQVLIGRAWITITERKDEGKGRPVKIYSLSEPPGTILEIIGKEKSEQAQRQIARVQKLREYIV